ncbi:MAG: DUF3618 domain-containing protein [Solirubrobacteraceae bacterium]|nr:DUF3618 domain-containing protein [Solirubrobacteraceae bacterium]
MSPARTPDEIRASLEHHRRELTTSIERLQADVTELSDWRSQIRRNEKAVVIGTAVAGFVLAGGIGALTGMLRRRRR